MVTPSKASAKLWQSFGQCGLWRILWRILSSLDSISTNTFIWPDTKWLVMATVGFMCCLLAWGWWRVFTRQRYFRQPHAIGRWLQCVDSLQSFGLTSIVLIWLPRMQSTSKSSILFQLIRTTAVLLKERMGAIWVRSVEILRSKHLPQCLGSVWWFGTIHQFESVMLVNK